MASVCFFTNKQSLKVEVFSCLSLGKFSASFRWWQKWRRELKTPDVSETGKLHLSGHLKLAIHTRCMTVQRMRPPRFPVRFIAWEHRLSRSPARQRSLQLLKICTAMQNVDGLVLTSSVLQVHWWTNTQMELVTTICVDPSVGQYFFALLSTVWQRISVLILVRRYCPKTFHIFTWPSHMK